MTNMAKDLWRKSGEYQKCQRQTQAKREEYKRKRSKQGTSGKTER